MEGIAATGQTVAVVTSPLVVALLCLYARHRRIGADDLLLWALGHLLLSVAFLALRLGPAQSAPDELHVSWRIASVANSAFSWLVLLGVVALNNPHLTARRGLLIAAGLAVIDVICLSIDPRIYMYSGMFANPVAFLVAAGILVWGRRSAIYVLAGIVLAIRSVNGALYVAAVHQAGFFHLPPQTAPLSIFLNLLTGILLLAIAIENAWQRLGVALEQARFSEAVMDLAPVSILHKDRTLKILRANRYFAEHVERFRHGHDSVLGGRSGQLMPADGAAAMEQIDRQLLVDPQLGPLEREVTMTPAAGPPITLLVRKAAVINQDGEATGVISASLDITRLKAVEAALREQIAIAEQASKAKSDFLANMSHELRTPLNGISGFAEMLSAGYLGPLTERQKEYLDNILTSSHNMLALVSRILDLSRLDADEVALQRKAIDLGTIVADVLADAAPMATELGIEIESRLIPAVASVDPVAMRQVVSNLVSNAIRFNRSGGKVSIDMQQREGRSIIIIADTGIGMTPTQIDAAGDPFLRTNPLKSRRGGGAGLGLAISRTLIELHGGDLLIASVSDTGTTVTISL